MKKILVLISILILVMMMGCSRKPKDLTKVTVTLDWTPNTNHTGMYVALKKGFYKAEGLDVQIVQPGDGITLQLLGSGKSDFGISYQEDVTTARESGIPVVSVAAVVQHNTSAFAYKADSGIKTPKDFENKRYGDWGSPTAVEIIRGVMERYNGDINKVKVVSGITDFFNTIGKDADFEWVYYGWDGIEAKRRNLPIEFMMLRDLDLVFDYYTPVIATNENLIKTNPDLIKRFMKATAKGYEWAIMNPDFAAQILMEYAPELNKDLVLQSQRYLSTQYQADAKRWGYQKESVWHNYAMWMYNHKLLKSMPDVKKAFTNDFLPEK